jgi:hypothetical protein
MSVVGLHEAGAPPSEIEQLELDASGDTIGSYDGLGAVEALGAVGVPEPPLGTADGEPTAQPLTATANAAANAAVIGSM